MRTLIVVAPVVVTRIKPTTGPTAGSSVITIYGNHFFKHDLLVCKLGTLDVVYATYFSASHIACLSNPTSPAGSVTLEISQNNQDFTTFGFEYIFQGKVHSFIIN